MRLRLRFVVTILVLVGTGAYIALGLRLGVVTLSDFFNNVFSVVVYVFLTSLGTTIILLVSGQWKPKPQTEGPKPKAEIPWVMKTSERRLSPLAASKLDPKFGHVFALFFYPPQVSWERGERNPNENMPRFKAILNTKTRPVKAFWMGVYANDLFQNDRIEYITVTGNSEADMWQYFAERGIELIDKPASEADLLEGRGEGPISQWERGVEVDSSKVEKNERPFAECANCGNRFYPPLPTRGELATDVTVVHTDYLGRTSRYVNCPKCGKSALVYYPPKTENG